METYKCLNQQVFQQGKYTLLPIRYEDRYKIMEWRNEQILHLRQTKPLSREDQDIYFNKVIVGLFEQEQPTQVLFSFLKEEECIGYGGLVHINWVDQTGEISFVMSTALQEENFETYWTQYLQMLKRPAFKSLGLHKIYTYAFDIRPRLYVALSQAGFTEEARLKEHCCVDGDYKDVLIHSLLNPCHGLELSPATRIDVELIYQWANDPSVRAQAINTDAIAWEDHLSWYNKKLMSADTQIYIARASGKPVGQVRLERESGDWLIDYSVDINLRGLGLGESLIREVVQLHEGERFRAQVRVNNVASMKVFEKLGYEKQQMKVDDVDLFEYSLNYE